MGTVARAEQGTINSDVVVSIIFAVPEDLDAVKALADCAKASLGFVRRGALAEAIQRNEVLVASAARAILGYCYFYRRRDGVSTIYHLVVDGRARRMGIGQRLVKQVVADARQCGATMIRLKCPADLEANDFYERVGFRQTGVEDHSPRPLKLWEMVVQAS